MSDNYIIEKEKEVQGLVLRLLREKGTPKYRIAMYKRNQEGELEEIWRSKPFLIRQDLVLTDKKIEALEAKIEEKGIPILAFKNDFRKVLLEIVNSIPLKVTIPPAKELGLEFKKVRIEELSTKHLYQPIEVEAQVIGASEFLSLPVRIELICKEHGERKRIFIDFTKPRNLEKLLFKRKQLIKEIELKVNTRESIGILKKLEKIIYTIPSEDLVKRFDELKKRLNASKHSFVENENGRVYIDLKILKLRDLPENVEKFSESLQFKVIDAYLIGRDLPRSKKVRIRGYVINRPVGSMNRLVIVAFDIEPLNEIVEKFKDYIREHNDIIDDLKRILPSLASNVRERFEKLKDIIDDIIAPKIIGRRFEKLVSAITLVSPNQIVLESTGEVYYGMLRTMHYGDTKTGKTETNAYISYVLGLGDYATCETGTRTGILYTIDTELKTIIWGLIPLCDREVAVIDGFNALPKDEMKAFREALEHFRVRVRRYIQGDAWARTRIIAIANPTKKMKTWAYSIEAVKHIQSLKEDPDYTRFDLFIPWSERDVSIDEIVMSKRARDPEKEDLFRKLVLLSWNTIAVIPGEIEDELNKLVKDVVNKAKGLDIPVIHSGYKKVLTKIVGAFACLLQKFEIKGDSIVAKVDKEVLEIAKLFINEYLERLDLEDYVANMKKELTEEEINKLLKELEDKQNDGYNKILTALYKKPLHNATYSELEVLTKINHETLRKKYIPKLKALQLVYTKPNKGVVLTDKGSELAAWIIKPRSKNDKESSEEKRQENKKTTIEDYMKNNEKKPSEILAIRDAILQSLDEGPKSDAKIQGYLTYLCLKGKITCNFDVSLVHRILQELENEGLVRQVNKGVYARA